MHIPKDTEIVDGVGFTVDQEISLSQLIEKYGEPSAIDVSPDGIPEAPATYMIVFFGQHKIRADFGSQKGLSFQLDAASIAMSFVYYSGLTDNMHTYTQPWKGYGLYECIGLC